MPKFSCQYYQSFAKIPNGHTLDTIMGAGGSHHSKLINDHSWFTISLIDTLLCMP